MKHLAIVAALCAVAPVQAETFDIGPGPQAQLAPQEGLILAGAVLAPGAHAIANPLALDPGAMMPEIGRPTVDKDALLRAWIAGLET